jgi:hypothetical protein
MKEICIPLTNIADNKYAEVDVRMPDEGKTWHYRIESLELGETSTSDTMAKVKQIQHFINSYNSRWELLQIMDTPKDATYIQLLYRERS